jgi:ABC-type proline/glycine betaine transport system permease subunit
MALIPAFEIGLWNAWIFELYALLPILLLTFTYLNAIEKKSASQS